MSNNNKTIFQRLGGVLRSYSGNAEALNRLGYNTHRQQDEILFQTTDK